MLTSLTQATKQDFFKAIFGDVEGFFEIRLINKNGYPKQKFFNNIEELTNYELPNDQNVYFGCAPRATKGGKKENVCMVTALWCDLDYGEDGHKQKTKYRNYEEALDAINDKFSLYPSIINDSGGGLHLYWLLSKPEPVDTPERRDRVENLMRSIAAVLGGDSTHDVSRIFRMPDSYNLKLPDKPRLCRIIHFNPDTRYDIADIESFVESAVPETEKKPSQSHKDNKHREIPGSINNLILTGSTEGFKSRSERDMSIVIGLVHAGMTDGEIICVFEDNPCGDKFREQPRSQGKKYLDHTIKKARAKSKQSGDAKERKKNLDPGMEANKVLEQRTLIYISDIGFYEYMEGVWKRIHNDSILQTIDSNLGSRGTKKQRDEVIDKLRVHSDVFIKETELNKNRWLLNLNNGMYDVNADTLLPHEPKYLSTVRMNVNYNPDAACPLWKLFVEQVLTDEESRLILQEIFGLMLVPETKYEKAFFLHGHGCNGKSRVLFALEAIIGDENISRVGLHTIGEKFHLVSLREKLVNMASETPTTDLVSTEIFKKLVSGEPVEDSYKGQNRFTFTPFARLIFSLNELPRITDDSDGLWRRIIVLEFPNNFEQRKDTDLLNKLPGGGYSGKLAKELDGIFLWSLQGLKRLVNAGKFTESTVSKEATAQFRMDSNPVATFLEDMCELSPSAQIKKSDLYGDNGGYREYCKDRGYKPLNDSNFFKKLKGLCSDVDELRRREGGKQVKYMQGIRIA